MRILAVAGLGTVSLYYALLAVASWQGDRLTQVLVYALIAAAVLFATLRWNGGKEPGVALSAAGAASFSYLASGWSGGAHATVTVLLGATFVLAGLRGTPRALVALGLVGAAGLAVLASRAWAAGPDASVLLRHGVGMAGYLLLAAHPVAPRLVRPRPRASAEA